ncbi:mechanosensitive ion channel family protein [Conexibacter woesei]|uniref:mechanosensitive ion channel family protein n=1 Tax=Conexibacter woesei TaxID=191495 RepID=UPI0004297011|nr:mechanosensitive ion channel domain-containing protein [Conexibacter woesei]
MLHILASESFLDKYDNLFTAVGILLAGALIVFFFDRYLVRRATRAVGALTGEAGLSRDTATRLRFARRAIEAVVGIIVVAVALSEFDALDQIGHTILASSAITAAVIGFAARQTLANAVAGILLAVVQPIRIGDLVTFEGETGTVEDVGLTYTWLRTGADSRLLVPNERLAGGIIRNDSIRSPTVATEVSVWLAPDADEAAALEAIRALEGVRARIAETTHEGVRILVMGAPGPPSERLAREGDLRASALGALRGAGVR